MREVRPDRHWWRSKDGLGLVAGSPGTFFRVTEKGARVLDSATGGGPVAEPPLLDRLIAGGAVHPVPGTPVPAGQLTVVIPCFARDAGAVGRVQKLVEALAPLQVIVVDDASPFPVSVQGATVVRRGENGGPGAARNTGLEQVSTPCVAFVDDDVHTVAGDILRLTGHFTDPNVAMVAPRIVTPAGRGFIAEYETVGSRLDMGTEPARVRPGSVVPYVPTAVLVARTSAMTARFDPGMRTGEDVEFVWRTQDDSAQCRYEPQVQAEHTARPSWTGFFSQRFSYGRSAADIDARIPWSVAPVRGHILHFLPLALLLCGQSLWALDALFLSAAFSMFTLRGMGLRGRDRLAIAALSVSTASRHLATAVSREWWPLFVVLSGVTVNVQVAFVFCVAGLLLADVYRVRPQNIGMFVPLRILDNLAYGAGVWAGAVRRRSLRCLLPRFSVWRRRAG